MYLPKKVRSWRYIASQWGGGESGDMGNSPSSSLKGLASIGLFLTRLTPHSPSVGSTFNTCLQSAHFTSSPATSPVRPCPLPSVLTREARGSLWKPSWSQHSSVQTHQQLASSITHKSFFPAELSHIPAPAVRCPWW